VQDRAQVGVLADATTIDLLIQGRMNLSVRRWGFKRDVILSALAKDLAPNDRGQILRECAQDDSCFPA